MLGNCTGKSIALIIFLICLIVFLTYRVPRRPALRTILPALELDTNPANQLEDLFNGFLISTTHCFCDNKTQIGRWYVCNDVGYKPKPPCLTYTFSIGVNSTFDLYMKYEYGCEVYSFDPFVEREYVPEDNRMNFHSIGIKDKTDTTDGVKFMTLRDIRKYLHHSNRALEILKIDIEGDEYLSLMKAIEDGELNDVKQLMVDFHVNQNQTTDAENIHRVGVLLLEKLIRNGFRIYYVDTDTTCDYISYKKEQFTRCYRVYWLKVS